jgi:6-methylsalicylate decarboxylase
MNHGINPDLTRRRLMTGFAAAGAAALLPAGLWSAQKPDYIDVHHHVFPPEFMAMARSRSVSPAIIEQWTLQRSLDEMDRNGIQTAITSITQPGVWFGEVEPSRTLARACNEYMARLAVDHPGRFGFFAAIPMPDTEGSLREIAYALDVLKADGIGLITSYGDKWPGDPSFAPIFDELNRRKAVVYFHPTGPDCCRALMPNVTPNFIEYPHDTARAITSLLFSGTFIKQRDIRFMFSHAGGTLPVLAGRISQLASAKDHAEKMPQGLDFELQRLYYEVANSANRSAIAALHDIVPLSQIMLGSDYPYVPIGVTNDGLNSLGFTAAELRALRRDNALKLLPRLKA